MQKRKKRLRKMEEEKHEEEKGKKNKRQDSMFLVIPFFLICFPLRFRAILLPPSLISLSPSSVCSPTQSIFWDSWFRFISLEIELCWVGSRTSSLSQDFPLLIYFFLPLFFFSFLSFFFSFPSSKFWKGEKRIKMIGKI